MTRQKYLSLVTLFVALVLLAGCHGNPDVQKVRYLDSGKRFSVEGKYREAAIQFLNAIKVDKNYPEAHYELAQAYEHLGRSVEASAEFARTVDLQPGNLKARVEARKPPVRRWKNRPGAGTGHCGHGHATQ